ncbi:hypothetical protein HGA34_01625 [Candidatus Falkowbacteria bacterium]|nr:hypothetical protein [Candidatus Falkowbacteria bacterium]
MKTEQAEFRNTNLSLALAAFAIQDDINGLEGEDRKSHQLLVQSAAPKVCERKVMALMPDVEVKVPKAGGLRLQTEQIIEGKSVPAHYHHVKNFKGVFVNCHYYGITPFDFGHEITAIVEVVDKIIGERRFTFINFRKVTTSLPEFDMKIMPDTEGILLAGTDHSVHFLPRQ